MDPIKYETEVRLAQANAQPQPPPRRVLQVYATDDVLVFVCRDKKRDPPYPFKRKLAPLPSRDFLHARLTELGITVHDSRKYRHDSRVYRVWVGAFIELTRNYRRWPGLYDRILAKLSSPLFWAAQQHPLRIFCACAGDYPPMKANSHFTNETLRSCASDYPRVERDNPYHLFVILLASLHLAEHLAYDDIQAILGTDNEETLHFLLNFMFIEGAFGGLRFSGRGGLHPERFAAKCTLEMYNLCCDSGIRGKLSDALAVRYGLHRFAKAPFSLDIIDYRKRSAIELEYHEYN